MGHKYCGKNWDEMKNVLYTMCDIEDVIELTEAEQDAFDIAIQCVTTIMNMMNCDDPVAMEWDDE